MALTLVGTVFAPRGTYSALNAIAPAGDYIICEASLEPYDQVQPRAHVFLYAQVAPIGSKLIVFDPKEFYNPVQQFKREDSFAASYAWGIYVHENYRFPTLRVNVYR